MIAFLNPTRNLDYFVWNCAVAKNTNVPPNAQRNKAVDIFLKSKFIIYMNNYSITLKQIINDKVTLEDIRDIFLELGIKNVNDFNEIKKSGKIKIPSLNNLNALCKTKKGKNFETFFFGNTALNLKIEQKLIDFALVEEIKNWCSENNVTTLTQYRFTKRPKHFPTYKATVNNYGEDYFYDILGLQKLKSGFSNNHFDEPFMKSIEKVIIKESLALLTKNINGLTWIELLSIISGKRQDISLSIIESIILNELNKNNDVEAPTPGFFRIKSGIIDTYKNHDEIDNEINSNEFLSINNRSNIISKTDNISIEYLYKKDIVSFKVYVILKEIGINNLMQLKNYVEVNNNFLRVKGCGNQENYDLLKLYEDYFLNNKIGNPKRHQSLFISNKTNKSESINKTLIPRKSKTLETVSDFSVKSSYHSESGPVKIDYLYSIDAINFRTYEIFKKTGIHNLIELHNYIEKYKNFCGVIGCTNEENYNILDLYENFYSNFLNNEKIEIKTTDNKRIKEIKKIIIIGLPDNKNENKVIESDIINNNLIENEYKFDGYSFIVKVVEMELAPLYWVKREGLTQYLFFNKAHQKSSLLPEAGFTKFLIALTRTSLSFSDDSGDIFLNRLKNYLDLI